MFEDKDLRSIEQLLQKLTRVTTGLVVFDKARLPEKKDDIFQGTFLKIEFMMILSHVEHYCRGQRAASVCTSPA